MPAVQILLSEQIPITMLAQGESGAAVLLSQGTGWRPLQRRKATTVLAGISPLNTLSLSSAADWAAGHAALKAGVFLLKRCERAGAETFGGNLRMLR